MTIKEALILGVLILEKNKHIDSPKLDAEIILSLTLKKPLVYLLTHDQEKINSNIEKNFFKKINQRKKLIPIAYLEGRKEFFSLLFFVNKNVLVPRPETEILVEEALKIIKKTKEETAILDIGTGSGAIIISLIKNSLEKKNLNFYASDISRKALLVTKKNLELHNLKNKVNLKQGSLLNPFKNLKEKNLLILANLPYLTKDQIKNSPTIKHEPKLALDGKDKNGLKLYFKLFTQIKKLTQKNKNITLICEIDPSQKKIITDYYKQEKNISLEIKNDLAGLSRIIVIKNN